MKQKSATGSGAGVIRVKAQGRAPSSQEETAGMPPQESFSPCSRKRVGA